MILKLDLEKAFDRLEWSFIYKMLNYFKFRPAISALTLNCITSSRISILVNDSMTEYFSPSRGIRQGCPLSPCIFILCMEMFSRLISHQVDICQWDPIHLSPRDTSISHLFFADDLTLMASLNEKSCKIIKNCLSFFCKLSGQNINLQKSRILVSKNCHPNTAQEVASFFNIKIGNFFGKYLSYPILTNHPYPKDYQYIIDNMQRKLSS